MTDPARAEPTIVHELPGRLRVHVPNRSEAELQRIAEALCAVPAVQSAEANPLTGNLLLRFDARAMDIATMADLVCATARTCATSQTRSVALERQVAPQAPLRQRPRGQTKPAMTDASPDPARVIWPLVHLIFSASPLGVALHVGEVLWAVAPLVVQRATRTTGADPMRDADVELEQMQATGHSRDEAFQTMNGCTRNRLAPGA